VRAVATTVLGLVGATLLVVVLAVGASGANDSCPAASTGAVGGIPANLAPLYEGAAAQYQLGPDGPAVLAAINHIETDFGQNLSTSTAGAVGWMQFEPGTWARYGVTPSGQPAPDGPAGWNDPADAIYSAANYLHASGAPQNWTAAIYTYNHATWYVQEVLSQAATFYQQGGGTRSGILVSLTGTSCPTELSVGTVPGTKAQIEPNGLALAPADAPAQVQAMIAAGDRLIHFDYQWGGGHANPALSDNQVDPQPQGGSQPGQDGTPGYDCSGATSYVLWGGGYGQSVLGGTPLDSTGLESVGEAGPGQWVTWYASATHVYVEVAGIYLDTAGGEGRPPNPPTTGPRWSPVGTGPGGFVARHPPGL
jgi:hypothetical protein